MTVDLSLLQTIDVDALPDDQVRPVLRTVLSVIEDLAAEVAKLEASNRQLRDEVQRLKGEQGVPKFPPRTPPSGGGSGALSSETERREPRRWSKSGKLLDQQVTRTERLTVNRTTLPADAVPHGTESVLVQELRLVREVIRFEREVWYSPSARRRFLAPLPPGYTGQFGPHLKALVLALHQQANVTEAKLRALLADAGVSVSAGWLAGLLAPGSTEDVFTTEAQAVEQAGLASSSYQHLDTTSTRVNGEPHHCHVLTNPLSTVYHTTERKDRLTVLRALQGCPETLTYRLDAVAEAYLDAVGLSPTARSWLRDWPREQALDERAVTERLERLRLVLGPRQQTTIREALALAAYQARTDWPIVPLLVCDDAAQFRFVTADLALCWVHEGRHYKKLIVHTPTHQQLVDGVLADFWNYYRELLAFRQGPSAAEAARLADRFDALFGQATGLRLLDERLRLTHAKKTALLAVLRHPQVPLHNNPAELAVRRRVRKRDASFGPRRPAGLQAWDTFQTLAATTQQLGVSFLGYLTDRCTQAGRIPPLADILRAQAAARRLNPASA
ncbi:MAG: transposase [Chloroflexota bacterium]